MKCQGLSGSLNYRVLGHLSPYLGERCTASSKRINGQILPPCHEPIYLNPFIISHEQFIQLIDVYSNIYLA